MAIRLIMHRIDILISRSNEGLPSLESSYLDGQVPLPAMCLTIQASSVVRSQNRFSMVLTPLPKTNAIRMPFAM